MQNDAPRVAEMSPSYKTAAEPRAWAYNVPVFCAHDKIVPVSQLQPNMRNPNQHPTEQIQLLAEIIKAQGWRAPITVSTLSGLIVRGHCRFAAARILGADAVPVDYQNYASDAEEWADLVADNRIAEFAEFDDAKLAEVLAEINTDELPLMFSGYTEDEYDSLLASLSESDAVMEITDDIVPELPEIPTTISGDVWYIGKHVLICGDSTMPATYERLLGDEKAQLIITDPPYNVDYQGAAGKIMNDKQKDANFKQFLLDAFSCVRNASTLGASAYIFHADTEGLNFRWAFMEAGFTLKQCLVWAKNVFVLGRQDYHWQHEPILYGWLEGKAHYFINDRTQSTLLRDVELDFNSMKKGELLSYIKERVPTSETNATVVYENKPTRSELHPTMKPVRLVARLINNSSKLGQIVLDPFAGSGSTIMACEYLGRRARAAELDPRFCDVIVKRYIEVTEKTDVKCVRGGREFTLEELNKLPMPNTGTGRCAALHRIDVYIGNIDEARIIPQKLGVQHNGKTKDTFYRISYKT